MGACAAPAFSISTLKAKQQHYRMKEAIAIARCRIRASSRNADHRSERSGADGTLIVATTRISPTMAPWAPRPKRDGFLNANSKNNFNINRKPMRSVTNG